MTELLELKEGALPWEPPRSEGVKILNEWGIPLSGLIHQDGRTFFFLCLEGEVASANLWGYVPLEAGEEAEIIRDHSHDAFKKLAQGGRVWLAALSVEDQGIVRWARVGDERQDETALRAAMRSLRMNEEDLNRFLTTA
jgi:hypothetical protein